MEPIDFPQYQRISLQQDKYGRDVFATRIGGLVVYEVEGADGFRMQVGQPATRTLASVLELIESHEPA